MAQGRITYWADWDYVDKQLKEFTLTQEVIEKLDSIEPGAERNYIQWIKVNWEPQTPDQYRVVDLSIPEVEDTLSSYDNTAALSARQWRVLYNYIRDLQQVWHFLSNWNCSTWLPQTNPQTNPYVYNTWDYFIVSNVSSWTNYKPNWSQYIIWQASITVESDEVKVWDFYVYDWTNWLLLINTERQIAIDTSLSTTSTNPVENRVITNALNLKANDADISTVWKTNDYNDIDNLPSIPDSLDDLSWDSDDIIEWSTHLFLTTSERTNLSHQSWVNTWDENQWSIKQKLWAASSSSDWYLTSTDWSTFNDKQDEISDLSDIRNNATAWKNASDTIATYWNVVTHDTNEFATAAQWAKADTALQSWDNVSELVNDAGYITDAYHDDTKQDKLIAWTNIQIASDWKTVSATDTTYVAWTNITIDANNEISAVDTTYTAGTWIDITNWVISNTQTSAEWWNITWTLSDQTDLQSALDAKQDDMVILKYGISTWNDFITAYNKNAVVYCRASSQSNPASGAQTRLAFMAYVNQETNPTSVEFQYYRSRSDHNSAANQLDQVFVYQLTSSNWWTWSVIERNTAAKATAWTWINLTYGSGNMTIANTWVTSVNSQTWDVTITIPTNVSDFVNDAWYITANDLPTVDTSMSDSSTNAVQNKVIKSYVDTQVQEATAWAVSDTAYWSGWDWVTGIAPSKNAVYDKIELIEGEINNKLNIANPTSSWLFTHEWNWAWDVWQVLKVRSNNSYLTWSSDASSSFHFWGVPVSFDTAVNIRWWILFWVASQNIDLNSASLLNVKQITTRWANPKIAISSDFNAQQGVEDQNIVITNTNIDSWTWTWNTWSFQTYAPGSWWTQERKAWIKANWDIIAQSFIKDWGTSSQFLKADWSIDNNTYADDANVVHKTWTETISWEKTFSSNVNYWYTQTYRDANGNASAYAYGVYQWGDNMQYTLRNAANNAYINTAFELTPTQMTVWRTLVVPNKTSDVTNNWTLVATEAQVYSVKNSIKWNIFVTQAEYNNLPSTKTTDWNTYIIYKT